MPSEHFFLNRFLESVVDSRGGVVLPLNLRLGCGVLDTVVSVAGTATADITLAGAVRMAVLGRRLGRLEVQRTARPLACFGRTRYSPKLCQ